MLVADAGVIQHGPALPQLPPGVVVSGPLVDAKLRESYLLLGILYVGSLAGVVWAFTQGVGTVELAVFAGMFALTTFGIGAGMHRLLVHRSFRCGPVVRTFFCAIAQMAVQGSLLKWVSNHRRHHLYTDLSGDPHSPRYDGNGNRYVSVLKGMLHAQGSWVFDQATTDGEYYAKDILTDPIAMFFVRTRWLWYGLSAVFIPGAIGYLLGGVHTMIGCVLFSRQRHRFSLPAGPRSSLCARRDRRTRTTPNCDRQMRRNDASSPARSSSVHRPPRIPSGCRR